MAIKPPDMIIGVWMTPIDLMPRWRSRGVNTLIGAPSGPLDPDRKAWRAAARANGLFYFDWPTDPTLADLSADAGDDHLLALMQPDEPDDKAVPIAELKANYDAFKRAGKPTYLGFDLWQMQWRGKYDYAAAVQCADWVGGDFYPANRGEPLGIDEFSKRIDNLRSLAPTKRTIVAIETSNQQLSKQLVNGVPWAPDGRGPTLAEWMAEVLLARSKGCDIFYFPDIIGLNWEDWDGTPPDIAAAMPGVAAALMPALPAPSRSYTITVTDDAGTQLARSTFKPAAR